MINIISYLDKKTDDIFKLIPLKQKERFGEEVFLNTYVDNIIIDMTGALETFVILNKNPNYISVLNILHYIKKNGNDIDYEAYRSQVLKMCNILNKINKLMSGGDN